MGKQNGQTLPQPNPAVTPTPESIAQEAANLYNQGIGFTPYPGETYVPMSQASRDALAEIEALARQPDPLLGQASDYVGSVFASGGLSPELRAALEPYTRIASGEYSVGSQDSYRQLYDMAMQPNAAETYLSGIASGAEGIGTPSLFGDLYAAAGQPTAAQDYLTATARGDYLNQTNPYLAAQIADRSAAIANQVKDVYSGMGRYGSSALNRDLADRLAQFETGILAQNWEAERARQMQAVGMIDAAAQERLAAQYQALAGRTNAEATNIGNTMNAAFGIDASRNDAFSAGLSALGGYTNAQQADIANMLGASGALADAYAGGLNRMSAAMQAVPGLAEASYAPAFRLAQVGAAREADEAARLADLVARYNYQQRAPMDALAWLTAISSGEGGFGQSVAPPAVVQSPWYSILGS